MKFSFNYPVYAILLLMALAFSSCQKELNPEPQPPKSDAIIASSSLAKLINEVSSNDGSFDNIVDGASCLEIRFPYSVEANGEEITINSKEDFNRIEVIFDAHELDDDILEIHFPITITKADFEEIVIDDKMQLLALAETCIEGGEDDDNECIDFVYPLALFTFDVRNEQTDNVVVKSDMELRQFFTGLDENDRVSFDFPVALLRHDGTEVAVNSNPELVSAIESVKNACDEDDDSDHNDDDFTKDRLDNLLVSCPWLITELERDDTNHSNQYYLSKMTFEEDGSVVYIDRTGNSLAGTWGTEIANNAVLLNLEFDVLVDFNLGWLVFELEEGVIKLFASGGNKVVLQSVCDGYDTEEDTLKEVLKECSWIIKKVKKGQEIEEFLGYDLRFLPENVVNMDNGSTTIIGTWEVDANNADQLLLSIVMEGDDPAIGFEWPLKNLGYEQLVFEDESGDNQLILEKNCDNDTYDEEVNTTRGMILEGLWHISSFTYNTDPNFATSSDSFVFTPGGVFKTETFEIGATWRVYRNSAQELEMILSFESNSNYKHLGNDWQILEITENFIELRHEDEDGGFDHLIFQRP